MDRSGKSIIDGYRIPEEEQKDEEGKTKFEKMAISKQILGSFDFADTKEGLTFWIDICLKLKNMGF